MTTMMPDIFGNYGPDPMLQRPQAGLASLLNPIREFVTRQPRPEVDQLMQDIQGRITEFMGSPVGPPNNIFQEPMPSRPILGIPDQPPSFGPVKTFLEPSFNYGKEQAEMRMMQRDVKSAEEQAYINKVLGTDTGMNMFNIPQAIAGLPSIFG
jgi:hypothetical protein